MLMSKHGVSDGRSHVRDLWGVSPVSRWVPVYHRLREDFFSPPRAKLEAAPNNPAGCADTCREVAS
jgi:hypothetical protein